MLRPRLTVAQLLAIVLLIGVLFGVLRIISGKNAEIADLAARLKNAESEVKRQQQAFSAGIVHHGRPHVYMPDASVGYVMGVDSKRREVEIDITSHQGAHPGMRMAVFESASPTIIGPQKGTIELVQVGEHISTARIIKSIDEADPIVVGDVVYSPVWSPGQSMRFALIGKIDRNRDGKDDRDELKRIIQQAGGVIDFDLPPPDIGPEAGAISPRVDWYVTDFVYDVHIPDVQFARRVGAAIKNARLNGIRPMPLDRLLRLLGYL